MCISTMREAAEGGMAHAEIFILAPQGVVSSSELPNCRTVMPGMTHLGTTFLTGQIILPFGKTELSQLIPRPPVDRQLPIGAPQRMNVPVQG
ncbi:hypothetical protein L3X38_041989 [Prunus dulcis]|uniref:Uncharacterized protein n=1 Tax=Prunus dulcis TaxID=3755 RepID=A0AAD4UU03_PRUDU|nr:hypothetical protein L3X38_041989 [Prunus dulcis]